MRHLLTELRQGLARNVSMHIAVVLTLFVSLTLAGVGVLAQREADKTVEYLGNELQITVWLCKADDDRPGCLGLVTDQQQRQVERTLEESPDVRAVDYVPQDEAYRLAQGLFDPELFEGGEDAPLQVADFRASYRVTPQQPDEIEGITSAVQGLEGVSYLSDQRDELQPVYQIIDYLKFGSLGFAAALLLAALLLVANTVRLAALARRKEIGIMRLVGASGLYISLPFLAEALFMALLGVALSGGALAALMQFGIVDGVSQQLQFLPWVGWSDYFFTLAVIGITGPLLTVLPTLLLTRKYSKV